MFKITYHDIGRLEEPGQMGEDIVIALHYNRDIFVLAKIPLLGPSYHWVGIGNIRSRLGNDATRSGDFFEDVKDAIKYILFLSYGCSGGRTDVYVFEDSIEFTRWAENEVAKDWLEDQFMKRDRYERAR